MYHAHEHGLSPSAADNTPALNALLTLIRGTGKGGRVYFGTGVYRFAGTVSADDLRGVTLEGEGRWGGATLAFTGTGAAAFISARSTFGFGLRGLTVTQTDPAYTGPLVDLSHSAAAADSGYAVVCGCSFQTASPAACGIRPSQAICGTISNCDFQGPGAGIRHDASYANVWRVERCDFVGYHGQAIDLGAGAETWSIVSCSFTPGPDGTARGLRLVAASPGFHYGLSVEGCWFGDSTPVGDWITVGRVLGLGIRGCRAGSGARLAVFTDSCEGVSIAHNRTDGAAIADFGAPGQPFYHRGLHVAANDGGAIVHLLGHPGTPPDAGTAQTTLGNYVAVT